MRNLLSVKRNSPERTDLLAVPIAGNPIKMREGGPFLIIIELFSRRAIDLLTRQAFQKRLICPEKEHPVIHGESGTIKNAHTKNMLLKKNKVRQPRS